MQKKFFGKSLFAYNIQYAVEKIQKKNLGQISKFFCRRHKMPFIQFPYMKIVWKAFVSKR